ncbi:MAG: Peptide deformylase [Parcubacteria group bacterium GW2011_GWF2_38_76]|nr:MAG: Peptide deformylase [Parcubacteria group bacterium GW2011_GWF2_38_76]HBM45803.1 peptide deformylase [Patescibacteria group bacterium]
MVEIIQKDDKILREISKEVSVSEITKPEIQKIISDMNSALDSQYDGVAIAAPQIGVSLRIFIIPKRVFENRDFIKQIGSIDNLKEEIKQNLVFINPVIKKLSKDKKLMEEGCLSVRPIFGNVRRATRATVEAYNEKGEKFIMEGTGLLAHIFQHEVDHLEGILFTDKAKNLREIKI